MIESTHKNNYCRGLKLSSARGIKEKLASFLYGKNLVGALP
jgi:hypothetical protein